MEVKKEPPDDSPNAQEEDDKLLVEINEKPQDDCLLEQQPPPNHQSSSNDQSQQARTRQRTKNHSTGGFTFKKDLQKQSRLKPIHICAVCDIKFTTKVLHKRHQNEFHGGMFKCDKYSHKRTHCKSINCETCQKLYSTNKALTEHQRKQRHGIYANSRNVAFVCDICDKLFSKPNRLKMHQRGVHDESEAECEVCGKICKNQTSLRHHSRIHVKAECPVCNKWITKYTMPEHLRTHSPDNSFECDLCEFSTKLKGSLRGHMRRKHLPIKLVIDSKCCEDFTNFELPAHYFVDIKEDSTAHQQEAEERNDDEPKAEVMLEPRKDCLPASSDLLNQTNAKKLEKNKQPRKYKPRPAKNTKQHHAKKFCCTKCGLEFVTKYGLLNHSQRIHECAACNAKFACKPLLDRHRLETHEKVIKCDKCPFRTLNENLLIAHQTAHHEFSCSICQMKFTRRQHLTLHQVRHKQGFCASVPMKVFDCDKCEMSFSNPKYLENHQASEHDGNEAKCDDCGKIFKNRNLLLIHRQLHDKVECPICHKMITARFRYHHLWSHSSKRSIDRSTGTKGQAVMNDVDKPDQLRETLEVSPTEVKREPPEEFNLVLPQSDDDSTEPPEVEEEEDVEPKWALVDVKELETDDSTIPSDDSTCQQEITLNQSLNPHPVPLERNSLATEDTFDKCYKSFTNPTQSDFHDQNEEDVETKLAQERPPKEHLLVRNPKRWVKSVKLAKFDAKWLIKVELFQTFFACPHCLLVVNYQQHLTQHVKDCIKMNQDNLLKHSFKQIFLKSDVRRH